jgi:hypothetical protein
MPLIYSKLRPVQNSDDAKAFGRRARARFLRTSGGINSGTENHGIRL